jgi:hypothetical protein
VSVCPVCRTEFRGGEITCSLCRADLGLLSHFMNDVRTQLDRADQLRQDGQLAPAVQAYLDVLEVDPANAEARAALGPILRAVRVPQSKSAAMLWMITGAAIAAISFAAGYWLARGN